MVGMAATPFGAHQVGVHIADHMDRRYATGHDVVGRVGASDPGHTDSKRPTCPVLV